MQHWVLKYYHFCSNDDSGLTLTYFMARSNLVPYAFVWEKGKTMGGCLPLPQGCIHEKSWKKLYKIRLQKDYFGTCNKWPKWQDISVDMKISSLRGCQPMPGAIYMYKIMKNCIKSDFKEIFLKLVANDRSDKRFLLTSKFCPLGLSAPELWLYTFIKSWKDVYKVRGWRDSF